MADKDEALAILRKREIRRINFTFPGGSGDVTVNARSFARIVDLINADTMHVKVDATLPADRSAQWDPTSNTVEMPPVRGRWAESNVVHESLHGLFDMDRVSVLAIPEEAACEIVDVLYLKMNGFSDSRFGGPNWDAAKAIAKTLLGRYAKGETGTIRVDAAAFTMLTDAIRAMPLYSVVAAVGASWTHDG